MDGVVEVVLKTVMEEGSDEWMSRQRLCRRP